MKKKTFEEKVKSMTAAEIIMAMVKGLKKRWVEIEMGSFGTSSKGRCFGCAATNTICQIKKAPFPLESISHLRGRVRWVNDGVTSTFLTQFENAIDELRRGDIEAYNYIACDIDIAEITENGSLPTLYDDFTDDDLNAYIALAKAQPVAA